MHHMAPPSASGLANFGLKTFKQGMKRIIADHRKNFRAFA
jgi:hypothetical protein